MLCIHPTYAIHFHTRFPWRLLFASCRRARGNSAHVSIVQVFMRRLRICSFLLRGKDVSVRLAFVSACLSPSLPRRPTPRQGPAITATSSTSSSQLSTSHVCAFLAPMPYSRSAITHAAGTLASEMPAWLLPRHICRILRVVEREYCTLAKKDDYILFILNKRALTPGNSSI